MNAKAVRALDLVQGLARRVTGGFFERLRQAAAHGGTRGVGENQMATWLTASESSVPLAEDTIMRMITFTRYDSTLCAQATKLGPCLYLAPVGPPSGGGP